MIQMLASVTNLEEAKIVLEVDVDLIDLKDPHTGALGALDIMTVKSIVKWIDKRKRVSATIGDLPMQPALIASKVGEIASTGVDIVKVGFFGKDNHQTTIEALQPLVSAGISIVAVLFADEAPDLSLHLFEHSGFYGVMLDTRNKQGKHLLNYINNNDLQTFINNARKMQMHVGLAGALSLESLQHLYDLQPDYLGFRGALCVAQQRKNAILSEQCLAIKEVLHKSNTCFANG